MGPSTEWAIVPVAFVVAVVAWLAFPRYRRGAPLRRVITVPLTAAVILLFFVALYRYLETMAWLN
jgi:hypothetical protein